MDFQDLEFKKGTDNMAGTINTAWMIPYSDIFRMPVFDDNTNILSDYATLYHNIIPKPYKTFYRIHATSDTGKINNQKADGKALNMMKSVYEFQYPKTSPKALGFMRLSGSKFVFIVQEADGNLRILGSKPGFPAEIKTNTATTGSLSGNEKGVKFQVISYQNGPAPIYRGLLNLDRDANDLSLHPMIYTRQQTLQYDSNGMPLITEFYLDNIKVFTWIMEWNNRQLARRKIIVNVKI